MVRAVIAKVRMAAFANVPGGSIPGTIRLFVCADKHYDLEHYPDLGWDRFCEALEVISLDVPHLSVLAPDNSGPLFDALMAIEASLRRDGGPMRSVAPS